VSKFKRASLAGSEELFRPTLRPRVVEEELEPEPPPSPMTVERQDLRVPLSKDEIELLLEAIHAAKYPERARRLPLEKFERYDALRDKLQEHQRNA
jgi:hypothetical protein